MVTMNMLDSEWFWYTVLSCIICIGLVPRWVGCWTLPACFGTWGVSERRVPVISSVQLHQVGITPLFLAVRGGHSQIVQFLCGSPSSRWNMLELQFWCKNEERSDNDPFIIYIYIYLNFLHFVGQVDHSYLWWSVCPSSYCILYDWLIYWYIYNYIYISAGKEWSVPAELRYSPGRCQQDIAGQWMHHSSHGLPQGQSECLCCVCRGFWGN